MTRLALVALSTTAIVVAISFYLFVLNTPADAQRESTIRWEYAAITGSFSTLTNDNPSTTASASANICFMQISGCLNEEVKAELVYSKFFQDMKLENNQTSRSVAQSKVIEMALSKAFARLGTEGWELVSPPSVQFMTFLPNTGGGFDLHGGDSEQRRADIYFKRLRR
jgi:hypothetical protein